jgi:hypothetical protein
MAYEISLVIKKILYGYDAFCKIDPFHESARYTLIIRLCQQKNGFHSLRTLKYIFFKGSDNVAAFYLHTSLFKFKLTEFSFPFWFPFHFCGVFSLYKCLKFLFFVITIVAAVFFFKLTEYYILHFYVLHFLLGTRNKKKEKFL